MAVFSSFPSTPPFKIKGIKIKKHLGTLRDNDNLKTGIEKTIEVTEAIWNGDSGIDIRRYEINKNTNTITRKKGAFIHLKDIQAFKNALEKEITNPAACFSNMPDHPKLTNPPQFDRNKMRYFEGSYVNLIHVITEYPHSGIKQELMLMKWPKHGSSKFDIRWFSADHNYVGKGISLYEKEAKDLLKILNKLG